MNDYEKLHMVIDLLDKAAGIAATIDSVDTTELCDRLGMEMANLEIEADIMSDVDYPAYIALGD